MRAASIPEEPRFRLRRLHLVYRDEAIEAAHRTAQRERNLRQLRLAFVYAALLNLPFGVMDLVLAGRWVWLLLLVRVVGLSGMFAGLIWLTYRPAWQKRWPALVGVALLVYSAFYVTLLFLKAPDPILIGGYAVVALGGYVLFPFYFRHGVTMLGLLTIAYLGVVHAAGMLEGHGAAMLTLQFGVINAIGAFILYRQDWNRRRDWENLVRLDEEQRRYQVLLTSILPAAIADRLRRGEREIAERHEAATVLFADIVGFTGYAAARPPEAALQLLNRLFRNFDALAAKHGLEKIKTIGDSYMAAGGVPEVRGDHVEAAARLALDMLAATAAEPWPDERPLQVRIGLHTGELVAGVIGDSRFLYDLWGDTVNTASRMESTAEPGTIQVTEAVRAHLQDRFRFRPRGRIEVKGKGPMTTWYLEGPSRLPAAAPTADAATG